MEYQCITECIQNPLKYEGTINNQSERWKIKKKIKTTTNKAAKGDDNIIPPLIHVVR